MDCLRGTTSALTTLCRSSWLVDGSVAGMFVLGTVVEVEVFRISNFKGNRSLHMAEYLWSSLGSVNFLNFFSLIHNILYCNIQFLSKTSNLVIREGRQV